jgi:hypothetical protein
MPSVSGETYMNDLLIKAENYDPRKAEVLILEDHAKHLKSHVKHIFRRGMLRHILSHIYWAWRKRRVGLPTVEINNEHLQ